MTTTTPSAALIPVAPVFTTTERLALAGFLAGYSSLTRQEYEPPSSAGCAPSPGSTGLRWRKTCSSTRPPRTCAGPAWTMSRTPPAGPQRTRRAAGRRRAGRSGRARADLPAGAQRAASLRSHRPDLENLGAERGTEPWSSRVRAARSSPIPLAPRTAWAIDLAIGERVDGPIFLTPDAQRLDRHGAAR